MSYTKNFFSEKNDWSKHKDRLLKRYMLPYLTKVMSTGIDIVLIDGFAGRGKFEDGTIGSPLIIKNAIYEAKNISKCKKTKITPYFIEYEYAEDLKKNLADRNAIVISGDYRIETPNILSREKGKNLFLYVDPFGIKYLDFSIFANLNPDDYNSIELLLNLNSFGFIREACRLLKYKQEDFDDDLPELNYSTDSTKNTIENMIKIANGDYWIEIVKKYNAGHYNIFEAEKRFLHKYLEELKKIFKFVYCIPIRKSKGNLSKYQMIFATNHRDGAMLMGNNMIKCNNEINDELNGLQGWMFDYDHTLDNIKDDVLEVLDNNSVNIKDFYNMIYDKYGFIYLTSDINNCLKELELEDKVVIYRYPPKTSNGKFTKSMDIKHLTIKVKRK